MTTIIISPDIVDCERWAGAYEACFLREPKDAAALHGLCGSAPTALMLLPDEGDVQGFLCWRELPDVFEVLSIGVVPKYQGQGLALSMMHEAVGIWDAAAKACFLEVRASNKAAIALYERCGYAALAVRDGYYPALEGAQQREDALIMQREPLQAR